MDLALIVLLIKAFWVGVAVAAPMGPVGVYCIDRTLRDGLRAGMFAGIGASLADGTWAAIATYLVAILLGREKLESYRSEIFISAFPVLVLLGMWVLRKAMHSQLRAQVKAIAADAETSQILHLPPGTAPAKALWRSFFLTLSNPLVVLNFAGWVTWLGFGAAGGIGWLDASAIVGGVFLGGVFWWFVLAFWLHYLQERAVKFVPIIDYTCVVLTFGAAVYSLYEGWPALRRIGAHLGFPISA